MTEVWCHIWWSRDMFKNRSNMLVILAVTGHLNTAEDRWDMEDSCLSGELKCFWFTWGEVELRAWPITLLLSCNRLFFWSYSYVYFTWSALIKLRLTEFCLTETHLSNTFQVCSGSVTASANGKTAANQRRSCDPMTGQTRYLCWKSCSAWRLLVLSFLKLKLSVADIWLQISIHIKHSWSRTQTESGSLVPVYFIKHLNRDNLVLFLCLFSSLESDLYSEMFFLFLFTVI